MLSSSPSQRRGRREGQEESSFPLPCSPGLQSQDRKVQAACECMGLWVAANKGFSCFSQPRERCRLLQPQGQGDKGSAPPSAARSCSQSRAGRPGHSVLSGRPSISKCSPRHEGPCSQAVCSQANTSLTACLLDRKWDLTVPASHAGWGIKTSNTW